MMSKKLILFVIILAFFTGCTASDREFMQEWMEETTNQLEQM